MKFEVNTNVIPVISVGSYGSGMYDDYVCNADDIKESILDCAPDIVEEAIREVCPSAKVSDCSVYMPRYYNYETDELNFTLDISDEDYQRMYDECINDPDFPKFLKNNYKSYDGFISFMADNMDEFEGQEDYRKLSQLIMFLYSDSDRDTYQADYDEAVYYWLSENLSRYEEDLGDGVVIYWDYKDGKDGFVVSSNGEDVNFFPADSDNRDDVNRANYEAYSYCTDTLGVGDEFFDEDDDYYDEGCKPKKKKKKVITQGCGKKIKKENLLTFKDKNAGFDTSITIDMWYDDEFEPKKYGADAWFNDLSATYSGNIYDETGKAIGDYTANDSIIIGKYFLIDWGE